MFLFGASYGPMLCRSLSRICPYLKNLMRRFFLGWEKQGPAKLKGARRLRNKLILFRHTGNASPSTDRFWGSGRREVWFLRRGKWSAAFKNESTKLRDQLFGWVHPLTPYRCKLKTPGELNSVKLQPGGLVWKDWLGLNEETTRKDTKEIPALVVETFKHHIGTETKHGLWGFGYDFDNMKVRCWYEHHLPQLLSKEMQSSLQVAQDKAAGLFLGWKEHSVN